MEMRYSVHMYHTQSEHSQLFMNPEIQKLFLSEYILIPLGSFETQSLIVCLPNSKYLGTDVSKVSKLRKKENIDVKKVRIW